MSESAVGSAGRRTTGWLLGLRAGVIALALVLFAVLLGRALPEGAFDLERLADAARATPWAPLAAIGVFIVLGQTGFPQFMMIAAAVMAFGPVWGFALSWIGTMISASIGFALGRLCGADLLRRFGGAKLNGMSERLGRHGITTLIVLRNVPTGPFVAVNMMAGVSHIGFRKYLIGTAIGIVPKMAVIALFGAGFSGLLQEGSMLALAAAATVIVPWLAVMPWLRRKTRHWRKPGSST